MKRIALMTSGGDCPGLNACIRAVVRDASARTVEVLGVKGGLRGLRDGDYHLMGPRDVSGIIQQGGTILGTGRFPEFEEPAVRAECAARLRGAGAEGLVSVGGNGSMSGMAVFAKETGFPVVGVPKSIDNDIYGTDYSIGYDTALNTALEAIDRIRDTAASHERVFFVEVMGRASGFLALEAGLAGGAEEIIIPEEETRIEDVASRIVAGRQKGKTSSIVVVAEAEQPGRSFEMAAEFTRLSGLECRVCVLGYVQRGGRPTARDRILAQVLGAEALEALLSGVRCVMAGVMEGKVAFTPLFDVAERSRGLGATELELARRVARE